MIDAEELKRNIYTDRLISFVGWVEEAKPNIFLSRATEDNLCKYFKRWGKGYSETNMRINHRSLNS